MGGIVVYTLLEESFVLGMVMNLAFGKWFLSDFPWEMKWSTYLVVRVRLSPASRKVFNLSKSFWIFLRDCGCMPKVDNVYTLWGGRSSKSLAGLFCEIELFMVPDNKSKLSFFTLANCINLKTQHCIKNWFVSYHWYSSGSGEPVTLQQKAAVWPFLLAFDSGFFCTYRFSEEGA